MPSKKRRRKVTKDKRKRRPRANMVGTCLNSKGYPRLTCGPHKDAYVHRLVAEAMIGRPLLPSEDVHHKDGDRTNPHWTNLQVIDHQAHGYVSVKQKFYLDSRGITPEPLEPRDAGEDVEGEIGVDWQPQDEKFKDEETPF